MRTDVSLAATLKVHRIRLLWAGFAFVYVAIALLSKSIPLVIDENFHYEQINFFDHGDFHVADYLTTVPGYHALVAAILWITDQRNLQSARLLNALFGLLTIAAFYLLRNRASGTKDSLAALQFALLPILFPYNFLVYTDVLSLGLVLGAAAATLRERHILSGLLMIAALAVRQVNVIWLPLLAGIAVWPLLTADDLSWRQRIARAWPYALKIWPYAVGVLLFIGYWRWNGSISLSKGQEIAHPDFSLHVGNVYFTLFLCGLLFPLHVLDGLRNFAATIRTRPWLAIIPIFLLYAFWRWFRVNHMFNQSIGNPTMLHNYVLVMCKFHPWCKALLGVIAVAAACGLGTMTKLKPPVGWLFYPLAVLALGSFWMIEHRYALIPLGLWLAFRERQSRAIEGMTTALWAILAVCACFGLFTGRFNP